MAIINNRLVFKLAEEGETPDGTRTRISGFVGAALYPLNYRGTREGKRNFLLVISCTLSLWKTRFYTFVKVAWSDHLDLHKPRAIIGKFVLQPWYFVTVVLVLNQLSCNLKPREDISGLWSF